jgi:hypothetical protein
MEANAGVTSILPYYEGHPVALHKFQSMARIFVVPPAEEYYMAEKVASLAHPTAALPGVGKGGRRKTGGPGTH